MIERSFQHRDTENSISFKKVKKKKKYMIDFYISKPTLALLFKDSPKREFMKGNEGVLELS